MINTLLSLPASQLLRYLHARRKTIHRHGLVTVNPVNNINTSLGMQRSIIIERHWQCVVQDDCHVTNRIVGATDARCGQFRWWTECKMKLLVKRPRIVNAQRYMHRKQEMRIVRCKQPSYRILRMTIRGSWDRDVIQLGSPVETVRDHDGNVAAEEEKFLSSGQGA